jgi:pyruvate kinase
MPSRYQPLLLQRLSAEVGQLLAATFELEARMQAELDKIPPEQRESARNLIHYLAVRRHDIRSLQVELGQLGLSSLGRLEAHVAAGLESVLLALSRISGEPYPAPLVRGKPLHFHEGDETLARHTAALLGPPRSADAIVRIMVTLPSDAAVDRRLVERFVAAGMDVARINTAHDTPRDWKRMAANVRAAAAAHGREVRVLLDLAGPKLRTGAIAPGPEVVRVRPQRDARGIVIEPARVRLAAEGAGLSTGAVPVSPELLAAAAVGDQLRLRDASGRPRTLSIVGIEPGEAVAVGNRSVRFESGLAVSLVRERRVVATGRIGRLPPLTTAIALAVGDALLLTASAEPGRDAVRDSRGTVLEPARVPCTIPGVFAEVRVGERILFDDGKIAGTIEDVSASELRVRITETRPGGGRLKSDRGINLPDATLTLPSLTDNDRAALRYACEFADIVGLSFVRTAADVEALHAALTEHGAEALRVVLKIETRRGFQNLPQILLAALRRPPVGVMVARGDLGVEIGFERMAEVQEQILWLCEAAHVPVIWATQVLEGLTKAGAPTRGEVTDAAMSARAECVMLNKGPYAESAIRFLDDVLARMRDHHIKKTPMLRRLKVSEGRWEIGGGAEHATAAVPQEAGRA